jgi:hypothetical protein
LVNGVPVLPRRAAACNLHRSANVDRGLIRMSTAEPHPPGPPSSGSGDRFLYDPVVHRKTAAEMREAAALAKNVITRLSGRHTDGLGIDPPGADPISMQAVPVIEGAVRALLAELVAARADVVDHATKLDEQQRAYEQAEAKITDTVSRLLP